MVLPLKRVVMMTAGQSPSSEEVEPFDGEGLPFLQGNAEFGATSPSPIHRCDTASRVCQSGDILISIRAPVGALNIADRPYGMGRGLCAIRGTGIDQRFLWWLMHGTVEELSALAVGSTYDAVTAEDIGSLRVRVPEPRTQRAIADYLDAETARIDALIERRLAQVRLLRERFATLVRQLMAADTTPQDRVRLKRLWSVIDCKHRTPEYLDSGFPVVGPADIDAGELDLRRASRFVSEFDYRDLAEGIRRPRQGDIVYSRNASIGKAAYVAMTQPFTMGQDVCLITSVRQSQRFLWYWLNYVAIDQLEENKVGATFSRINVEQIEDLLVPHFSIDRQESISERLDEALGLTDELTALIASQVREMRERRQAVITAVVTGEVAAAA